MALVPPPTKSLAVQRQTKSSETEKRWMPSAVDRGWEYRTPREASLSWFLVISLVAFSSAVFLSYLLPAKEELPPMIEVDLGIDGIENEPPPLGEPDAGAGALQPEPPAEPEQPEQPPEPEKPVEQPVTPPEPIPEPMPEPEPEPEIQPAPEPPPTFVVPKEEPKPKSEPPKEKPKPVAKTKPKPAGPPPTNPQPAQSTGPAGSGIAGAKVGVKGSPGGVAGGRGGGRGDFISTPSPQYDSTARERRYEGRGTFLIVYEAGRVVSVSAIQSTGVPYLDARTIAHVKTRYRVKAGVSGTVRLPIVWQLKSFQR